MEAKEVIERGDTALGIEFGSTNIKAVLIDHAGKVLATGEYGWENRYEGGIWTYHLDDVTAGLQGCYASLKNNVASKYGVTLTTFGAIGISAMMHGYIAVDRDMKLLHPFETWRNTDTQAAADELTELFNFNIPLRWSVAHLWQRILDGEEHVKRVSKVFTLAAYVHYLLTGENVLGVGDASGMFPQTNGDYDPVMEEKFNALLAGRGLPYKLRDVFPKVLKAGEAAGRLTPEGAKLIDPSGDLKPGIPMCPPEGDAGTGMVATNAVRKYTGNTSAGTSSFAMLVLDKALSKPYRQLDLVTTPAGDPVAMAHANNGTTDINKWMKLFSEVLTATSHENNLSDLFTPLFKASLAGDPDCGGVLTYGYYSGENMLGVNDGRPLLLKSVNANMTAANFVRSLIYSSLATVKIGMDILLKDEGAKCDSMTGHGGLFKTAGVAQQYLADALNAPVTVMETASEGGPWGIALLADYSLNGNGKSLADWLAGIFANVASTTCAPDPAGVAGFETYIERYKAALPVEVEAANAVSW